MFFIFFFHSFRRKSFFFSFFLYSFKYFLLLALVSGFYWFLRSRCSMEMWCPDDIGPPAWGRACFNSPEWGGGSSPVKTEPSQIVLLLLLYPSVLPSGLTLFVSFPSRLLCPDVPSRAFVLLRLNSSSTDFQQFSTRACLAVPVGSDMHLKQLTLNPNTSKSPRLRHRNTFLHLQLLH